MSIDRFTKWEYTEDEIYKTSNERGDKREIS